MARMKDIAVRLGDALDFEVDEQGLDDFTKFLDVVRNDPELKGFILNTLNQAKESNDE